ncbi:SPOR domain-containing protein [Melaminivora alkalimesophila]|uniref:Sporulation related protein n=1 Tax=Melaminivora alkalimesophila TaxID=1165852 RepID=A0A317RCT1_9BURK|nr:SPOR domain-containing protein [Melaminivora alkalimesophila]PWW46893.1 hypothetical protein DFR36_103168 [Melaminivora alkalimesophila]
MLRLAVLLLFLANAGYYAWTSGLLREWGFAPAAEGEPERLHQQIAPEELRLLPPALPGAPAPDPAAPPAGPTPTNGGPLPTEPPATAAAAAPQACLQAGLLDTRQAEALRTALSTWPEGSWALEPVAVAGRWMVYMGRFPDEEFVARKRAELRALGIDYDRPGAAFEPGLSLGRFSTEEAAQRGLVQLGRQGVRSARVVQERPESTSYTLRLPAVDAALRERLPALRPALAGKELRPCE